MRTWLRRIVWQKILGFNRDSPWNVSIHNLVIHPENIEIDSSSFHVFGGIGKMFHAAAKIKIGKYCYIGPNTVLITQNHDSNNPTKLMKAEPITIGDYCWLGSGVTILPGVSLGDYTTVGAGAVVTKSFGGHGILVGIPAIRMRGIYAHGLYL